MKTNDERKEIPAGATAVEVAEILGRGVWLFESHAKPNAPARHRILEVAGKAVYDIGGDGADVDEVAFIRGGVARAITRELST